MGLDGAEADAESVGDPAVGAPAGYRDEDLLLGAALVPALIGATLAVPTRSAPVAIAVGVASFVLGEALISLFWDSLAEWGPAAVTYAVTVGLAGGPGLKGAAPPLVSYGTAALLAVAYAALSLAICSPSSRERDVTN